MGDGPAGNATRTGSALPKLPDRLEDAVAKPADLEKQLKSAKIEAANPFAMEEESGTKSARLADLDSALNLVSKSSPERTAAQEKKAIRPQTEKEERITATAPRFP